MKKRTTIFHKHSALTQIKGDSLTASQFKSFDTLFYNAVQQKMKFKEEPLIKFYISVAEFQKLSGIKLKSDVIKQKLKELVNHKIEVNLLNKDKKKSWSAFSLLAGVNIDDGIIYYSFPHQIMENLINPRIFAQINIKYISKLKSKAANIIYNIAIDYKDAAQIPQMTFNDLQNLFGTNKYNFREFRRQVLKKGLKEVNINTNLTVDMEEIKCGKKVVAIRFVVKKVAEEAKEEVVNEVQEEVIETSTAENQTEVIEAPTTGSKIVAKKTNRKQIERAAKIRSMDSNVVISKKGYAATLVERYEIEEDEMTQKNLDIIINDLDAVDFLNKHAGEFFIYSDTLVSVRMAEYNEEMRVAEIRCETYPELDKFFRYKSVLKTYNPVDIKNAFNKSRELKRLKELTNKLDIINEFKNKTITTDTIINVYNNHKDELEKLPGLQKMIASSDKTPIEILEEMADNCYAGRELLKNPNISTETVLANLIYDEKEDSKRIVVSYKNTPADVLAKLARDKSDDVRKAVARHENTPAYVLAMLARDENSNVREYVARNKNTPVEALIILANDEEYWICESVVENPNAPAEVLKKLANYEEAV